MRQKRMLAALLSLLLTLSLAACGTGTESVTVLREWDAPQHDEETVSGTGRDFRIGMVTDISGIHDESFNQGAWEGLQALSESTGCTVDYIETVSQDDFVDNFTAMAKQGFQLIWGIGYACGDAMLEVAKQYPDVHFAVIDSAYAEPPSNVTGVTFHAEEASFLVGYIAESMNTTGKLGFVGGISSELIDQFQYGYQAGVAYADWQSGKNTEVLIRYVGSWTDTELGYQLADELYNRHCDIIYHAAGGSGTGVINAARDRGLFAIGVDRDQAYLAPKNVLTSALKRVNVAVVQVSRDFMEEREIGGTNFLFGLAEGAVGIPEGHANYSDEIYDATLRTVDDIIAGRITPPATEEGYNEFMTLLARQR